MAATSMIIIKECLRYLDSISDEMNPSFAKAKAITGSWKTTPINSVSVVNVDMYESSVIVLCILSATLYVPKNLNEIGNST